MVEEVSAVAEMEPVSQQTTLDDPVVSLAQAAHVRPVPKLSRALPEEKVKEFQKVTFQDERWNNAIGWLRANGLMTRDMAMEIIAQGSRHFGIWQLHPCDVQGLVAQLLLDPAEISEASPALEAWIADFKSLEPKREDPGLYRGGSKSSRLCVRSTTTSLQRSKPSEEWGNPFIHWTTHRRMELSWFAFVFIISNLWATKVLIPGFQAALDVFGWPIYVARGCGMATALLTGLLFASMARGWLTDLSSVVSPQSMVSSMLDAHKELHITFGRWMGWFGCVHVIAHCLSTVVAIMQAHDSAAELQEINTILGCANPDKKGFWFWGWPHLLWPKCPITKRYKHVEEVFFTTTIGLSGLALIVLLVVIAATASKKQRSAHFERFWYLHNIAIVLWPVLMYVHGANAWVGVGVPLVVLTSIVPLLAYLSDRLKRLARSYLYRAMEVSVRFAVVRPGKRQGADGSMILLGVDKPPRLWRFRPGMYAFICMPEYSAFQWHPFTICSGEQEPCVEFIIAAVGDWTKELATRIMDAQATKDREAMMLKIPKLSLDGPYIAPTQTALAQRVLVAVGAGVGITPFLSLMSTILSRLASVRRSRSWLSISGGHEPVSVKRVHFFWMTRSADEFLFAKSHFTSIVKSAELRRKIVLHLHVTTKEPEEDPNVFLFREALRRQSLFDRRKFLDATGGQLPDFEKPPPSSAQFPACWLHGCHQDVLWVESVLKNPATEVSKQLTGGTNPEWSWVLSQNHSGGEEAHKPTVLGQPTQTLSEADEVPKPRRSLPIIFGRPNFLKEVHAIGTANPEEDVHIYACGAEAIVANLQDVVEKCNHLAEAAAGHDKRCQRYELHFERFG